MKNNVLLAITFMSFGTLFGAQTVSHNEDYVNKSHFDDEIAALSGLGEINEDAVFVLPSQCSPIVIPEKLGPIGVQYKDKKWLIHHDEEVYEIPSYDVDPIIRSMDDDTLIKYLQSGCYIRVGQYTNGDYNLKACARGLGGGYWGWAVSAYAGKFVTHFVCHSAMIAVAAATGPAAPATLAALEATFLPTVEAASTIVALSAGIYGGVLTGPV